jgi:hypothetical protein
MHFVIEVQEDIPVSPFLDGVSEALAARNVTAYLTDYFSPEAPGAQLRT